MSRSPLEVQFDKTHDMKVRWKKAGSHTHISVWCGEFGKQRAKLGELVMLNAEFEAWRKGKLYISFSEVEEQPK